MVQEVVVMKQEDKLKMLSPTLRERHRYIFFKIISEDQIVYSDLEQAIWSATLEFYGEVGASKLSLWLMKNLYDEKMQSGVIRCNNKSVDKIIAVMGLISRLGDARIIFKILKVSGTLRGLKL